jgi:hypothetical protein
MNASESCEPPPATAKEAWSSAGQQLVQQPCDLCWAVWELMPATHRSYTAANPQYTDHSIAFANSDYSML